MHAHPAHRAREPGFWGRLPLLMAVLAMAMQCFVLAPHVHAASWVDEVSVAAPPQADEAPEAAACTTCRAGAAARVFTPAPDASFTPPAARGPAPAPMAADQSVRLTLMPAWRSRAPPLSLS